MASRKPSATCPSTNCSSASARGSGRAQGAHVLGRHGAAPRSRARARPPSAWPPRRANDRPRSSSRYRSDVSLRRTRRHSADDAACSKRPTCSRTASHRPRPDRRRGHPRELKAEIGASGGGDSAEIPSSARSSRGSSSSSVGVAEIARRAAGHQDIVRALDAADLHVEHLQLHAPSRRRVSRADRRHARGRRLRAARDHRHVTAVGFQPGSAQPSAHAAYVIPPLLFPTMLVAVNAAGLRPSTQLSGFPTDSFLAFAVAVPFIQGALFATR